MMQLQVLPASGNLKETSASTGGIAGTVGGNSVRGESSEFGGMLNQQINTERTSTDEVKELNLDEHFSNVSSLLSDTLLPPPEGTGEQILPLDESWPDGVALLPGLPTNLSDLESMPALPATLKRGEADYSLEDDEALIDLEVQGEMLLGESVVLPLGVQETSQVQSIAAPSIEGGMDKKGLSRAEGLLQASKGGSLLGTNTDALEGALTDELPDGDLLSGKSFTEKMGTLSEKVSITDRLMQDGAKTFAWQQAAGNDSTPVGSDVAGLNFSELGSSTSIAQNRPVNPVLSNYSTSVMVPVADEQWGQAVSEKIVWMAQKEIQFAEIHLNPAELGPMEVKISVHQDQAQVVFSSQHAGVRELLEMNVNRLRDMLGDNGVSLSNFDVSDQQHGQQAQERDQSQSGFSGSRTGDGADDESEVVSSGTIVIDSDSHQSGIDFYA